MKSKMKICKGMPCAVQQPPLCDGWVNGSFCNQWKKLQRERSAQLRTATTKTSTNGVAPKQNSILEYQSQENCRPSREGTSGPFPGRSSPVSFSAWEFPGRLQTSSPRWRGAPPKPCKAGRGADMQPDSPDRTCFGHDAVFLQRRLQLLLNSAKDLWSLPLQQIMFATSLQLVSAQLLIKSLKSQQFFFNQIYHS